MFLSRLRSHGNTGGMLSSADHRTTPETYSSKPDCFFAPNLGPGTITSIADVKAHQPQTGAASWAPLDPIEPTRLEFSNTISLESVRSMAPHNEFMNSSKSSHTAHPSIVIIRWSLYQIGTLGWAQVGGQRFRLYIIEAGFRGQLTVRHGTFMQSG